MVVGCRQGKLGCSRFLADDLGKIGPHRLQGVHRHPDRAHQFRPAWYPIACREQATQGEHDERIARPPPNWARPIAGFSGGMVNQRGNPIPTCMQPTHDPGMQIHLLPVKALTANDRRTPNQRSWLWPPRSACISPSHAEKPWSPYSIRRSPRQRHGTSLLSLAFSGCRASAQA